VVVIGGGGGDDCGMGMSVHVWEDGMSCVLVREHHV
jgi:hypothetical protein